MAAAALGAWAIWGGTTAGSSATVPAGAAQAIEPHLAARRPASRGRRARRGRWSSYVTPNGKAVLIVFGLKAAPTGKEYQAWIVTGKTPHSAGLFKGGETQLVIPLAQRIPKGAIFAVTLEKAGGVPAPTQVAAVHGEAELELRRS